MLQAIKEKETSHLPSVAFGVLVYAAFIVLSAYALVGDL